MNSNETIKQNEGNIIEIKGLEKHFRSGGNDVKAVDGVTIGFPEPG
jgi:ABC-type oligopeptide transport system ATPase subunit